MRIKRSKMNAIILDDVMTGKMPAYESHFNGQFVWRFESEGMYGKNALHIVTDYGTVITTVTEENFENSLKRIDDAYADLYKILESKRKLDDYCSNNAWTRSGT